MNSMHKGMGQRLRGLLLAALWIATAFGPHPARADTLRVGVVGDTGIGERAYHPGFAAVQQALTAEKPDVLLHLGDFVYQPRIFPDACDPRYLQEIRATLVEPFPQRLFVVGDNDLPPVKWKPKASGCWAGIDPLDSPLEETPQGESAPGLYEGSTVIGNTMFALLNSFPWTDPTPWLKPRIDRARAQGLWVIVGVHEPAITTAWYIEKRATQLARINALEPDLVFSGNQHSYERFHPIGRPREDGSLPVTKSADGIYRRGQGTVHIITGGGGARLKPFADFQDNPEHTAPPEVFEALAARALMNHFLLLEIGDRSLKGTTFRVCAPPPPGDTADPRWKPDRKVWRTVALECDGKPPGISIYDRFQIDR